MKQKAWSIRGDSRYLVMVEGHVKFRPRMQHQKVGKHMSSNLKHLKGTQNHLV